MKKRCSRFATFGVAIFLINIFIVPVLPREALAKTVITQDNEKCVITVTLNKGFFKMIGESKAYQDTIDELKGINQGLESTANPGLGGRVVNWVKSFWADVATEQQNAKDAIDKNNQRIADLEKERDAIKKAEDSITDDQIRDKVNTWQKEMNDVWNGTDYKYGCCTVKFSVNAMFVSKPSDLPGDYDRIGIRVQPGFRSFIKGFQSAFADGFSSEPYEHNMGGNWGFDQYAGTTSAHEAGHELGLEDQYHDETKDGKTVSVPTPGHENDLMASLTGRLISQPHGGDPVNNIEKILKKRGLVCPETCCPKETYTEHVCEPAEEAVYDVIQSGDTKTEVGIIRRINCDACDHGGCCLKGHDEASEGQVFLEVSILTTGQGSDYRNWEPERPVLTVGKEQIRPCSQDKYYVERSSIGKNGAVAIFTAIGAQYEEVAHEASGSEGKVCPITGQKLEGASQDDRSALSKGIDRAGMAAGLGLLTSQAKGQVTGLKATFNVTGKEAAADKIKLQTTVANSSTGQRLVLNIPVIGRLFSRANREADKKVLQVIIQPRIVNTEE